MQIGRTALMSAGRKGHTDCVRLLIEGGADKDAKDAVRAFAAWLCELACALACFYVGESQFHFSFCFI